MNFFYKRASNGVDSDYIGIWWEKNIRRLRKEFRKINKSQLCLPITGKKGVLMKSFWGCIRIWCQTKWRECIHTYWHHAQQLSFHFKFQYNLNLHTQKGFCRKFHKIYKVFWKLWGNKPKSCEFSETPHFIRRKTFFLLQILGSTPSKAFL